MEIKQLNKGLGSYYCGIKHYIDDKRKPTHWFPPDGGRTDTWADAIKYAFSNKITPSELSWYVVNATFYLLRKEMSIVLDSKHKKEIEKLIDKAQETKDDALDFCNYWNSLPKELKKDLKHELQLGYNKFLFTRAEKVNLNI